MKNKLQLTNLRHLIGLLTALLSLLFVSQSSLAATWGIIGIDGDWTNDIVMSNTSGSIWEASVTLSASSTATEFKLRTDKSWTTQAGKDGGTITATVSNYQLDANKGNVSFTHSIAGSYKFTWDASTYKLSVTYPEVTHTYALNIKRDGSWISPTPSMTKVSSDLYTYDLTVSTINDGKLQVIVDGNYYGNTGSMVRSNCSDWTFDVQNQQTSITFDVPGTYKISYVPSTKKVSITYPYGLFGDLTGSSSNTFYPMTYNSTTSRWEATIAVTAGNPRTMRMATSKWRGCTYTGSCGTMTRSNCTNWGFYSDDSGYAAMNADVTGNYDFSWNESNNKLDVIYPTVYTAKAQVGSVAGGKVTLDDAAYATTNVSKTVVTGTNVIFKASASSGYTFKGWGTTSSATSYESTDANYTVSITSNKTLYAIFQLACVGPTVTTAAATSITTTTATLGGSYVVGDATPTEVGIEWVSGAGVTAGDQVTASSVSTPFSVNVTDLTANSTYKYKAYALACDERIYYGGEQEFTTYKEAPSNLYLKGPMVNNGVWTSDYRNNWASITSYTHSGNVFTFKINASNAPGDYNQPGQFCVSTSTGDGNKIHNDMDATRTGWAFEDNTEGKNFIADCTNIVTSTSSPITLTITFNQSTGKYTMTIEKACTAPGKPTVSAVASTVCSGTAPQINTSTESNVKYQLFTSGGTAASSEVTGDGTQKTITASSAISANTTYYVKATSTKSGCSSYTTNSDNVTITAKTQPTMVATFSYSNPTYVVMKVRASALGTTTVAKDAWGYKIYSDAGCQTLVQTVVAGIALSTSNQTLSSSGKGINLSCNTFYWVKAYATSECGTVYSSAVKVQTTPNVGTGSSTNVTSGSATLNAAAAASCPGSVTSAYTYAFFSISLNSNGTTDSVRVHAPTTAFNAAFSQTVSGTYTSQDGSRSITIQPNTKYYFRPGLAFKYDSSVSNSERAILGGTKYFTTQLAFGDITLADASVCVSSKVTLTPTISPEVADVTWTYSSNNESVATVNSSGVVTGVAAGTATITATVSKTGYESKSKTCTITVNAAPVAPGSGQGDASYVHTDDALCDGNTVTLKAPTGFTGGTPTSYEWYIGGIKQDGVTGSTCPYTISGTKDFTSYVYALNGSCKSAGSPLTTFSGIGVAPSTPSAINGETNPCHGASKSYSVTNVDGVTYNWTLPEGWTKTAGGNSNAITVTVGSTSGTISVTATTSCGTSSARELSVTANTTVMALTSIELSSASTCAAVTSTITPTGLVLAGGSIEYTSGTTSVATISEASAAGATITAVAPGSSLITATVSGGCGASVSKDATFTVNGVTVTQSPTEVHPYEPVTFEASAAANWTLTTASATAYISAASGTSTVLKAAVGSYTVTAEAGGCDTQKSVTVVADPNNCQ